MEKKDVPVQVRFSKSTIKRIDNLVEKKKFDDRSNFIRRAVVEYLDTFETKILA